MVFFVDIPYAQVKFCNKYCTCHIHVQLFTRCLFVDDVDQLFAWVLSTSFARCLFVYDDVTQLISCIDLIRTVSIRL